MVRRRVLQAAVAEKVDLVGICIAWRSLGRDCHSKLVY
jgi:hypothetical protein